MGIYDRVRPLLFALPPERAHELSKRVMAVAESSSLVRSALRRSFQFHDPMLEIEVFDTVFPNPLGVAAGFDKNAAVMHCLSDLGFGFVEVGTVTPYPQPGNERPRLFRLPRDNALINRLGFNSQGADRVRDRFLDQGTPAVPIGVNIGSMNTSSESEAVEDYRRVFERLAPFPDYLVVNVSCPNTPEEFDEDDPEHVEAIFDALDDENEDDKPILVKIGPDATRPALEELVDIVESVGFDGLIATNTTTDHAGLTGRHRDEWGGVSGAPLEGKATQTIRHLGAYSDLPIIGVGGVSDAEGAYAKIRAGASLVQLYTGFVYGGPATAKRINRGLVDLLREDGFSSVEEAVGADFE